MKLLGSGLGAVALAATAAILTAGGAVARSPAQRVPGRVADQSQVTIQQTYDPRGNPWLIANGAGGRPDWWICPPAATGECRLVKPTSASGNAAILKPGRSASGTVFEARLTVDGQTSVARSGVWAGSVRVLARPRLLGPTRVGATVDARGARWAGGWSSVPTPDSFGSPGEPPNNDQTRVEACRTSTPRRCVNLSPQARCGASGRARIGRRFTGWFLFALDARFANPVICGQPAYRTRYDVPPFKLDRMVAVSRARGPVVGPPAPAGQPSQPVKPRLRRER